MIVNKRSGDDLAVAFSKILNKSLKKQASESAGQMLLENDGSDKYDDKNFMKDTNHSSDAEVLSNSLDDSMNMLDDPESKYMKELGGLVDLDPKEELTKIASDLHKEGDSFSRDMVLATIKSL